MYHLRSLLIILILAIRVYATAQSERPADFSKSWKFYLADDSLAAMTNFNDSEWKIIDLPHDWSIEGDFSDKHATTANQAALPAGIGWYRKEFSLPASSKDKQVYINFDGVYRNSEVWINGHYLGKRPNGYISFRYNLTPFLNPSSQKNLISVRVNNSAQPNSRWYTGSGIYRKVYLTTTNKLAFDNWGVFVTTPMADSVSAKVQVQSSILNNTGAAMKADIQQLVFNAAGKLVGDVRSANIEIKDSITVTTSRLTIKRPELWSIENPYLYKVKTIISSNNKMIDKYETSFGIRSFYFDAAKGFFLNGKPRMILGVCNHHDLGALGAAVNKRAIERQLEILKAMGCNGIRTAHNPPAPELLELCDKMGFIVMDEAFDMWKKRKNRQDYSVDFDQWHAADLEDQVKRDRNHPSVFIWSIGNEIREQFDSTGLTITTELVNIVKRLDSTRPVTSALTENVPEKNYIYRSGSLDLLGFNYKLAAYPDLPAKFPGQKIIAAETMSALATRGHYDMPSDSTRLWPPDSKGTFTKGNADLTVSAYDNTYAYWGSSHEDGWNAVKKNKYLAGIFVWSGFDFLGEPVPYPYPARSSYYGIIDLAGFPKDVYYMYQSEWTAAPMLHLFPHWNWEPGKLVDVWAYYNKADEVELFLNGKSLGVKKKMADTLHVMWRMPFEPGTLKIVSRAGGKTVLEKVIKTAGPAYKIELTADRKTISRHNNDLSFVTVKILDSAGNLVPGASNLVKFKINGEGFIAGVDNGLQTSMEPFKASYRKAFNGLCLAIIQSKAKAGKIVLTAESEGLTPAELMIVVK